MRENADLPKWQARSLFFVVMLMTAPVFVLAFLVMYGGSEDAGGLPIWVIGAIVVWALSADHLLSWGADRFGLLGGMAKRPRERLFHALALAPLFAMIFVDGARQSLSPALAWVLGIAFIVFVMMTAPTLFGWVWQRVRSRLG